MDDLNRKRALSSELVANVSQRLSANQKQMACHGILHIFSIAYVFVSMPSSLNFPFRLENNLNRSSVAQLSCRVISPP